MNHLKDQRGITMIELVLAIMVLGIVAASTFTALASSKQSAISSERTQTAARVAENEFERIRNLSFEEIALRTPAPNGVNWIPSASEANRFTPATATLTDARTHLDADGSGTDVASEELVTSESGAIQVGPRLVESVERSGGGRLNTNFRVWTYVTWRDEVCNSPTDDTCSGPQDSKRVTLALSHVQPGAASSKQFSPRNVIWFSEVVIDENDGGPPNLCTDTDCDATDAIATQPFYLYDTSCNFDNRRDYVHDPAGSGGHPIHQTAAVGPTPQTSSYCWNTNKHPGTNGTYSPDLMGPATPPDPPDTNTATWDAMHRYATDYRLSSGPPVLYGYGRNGRPIKRSDQSAGCAATQKYVPGADMATANQSAATVHSWSTRAMTQPFKVNGRISLDLFVGTYAAQAGASNDKRGTICISLIDRKETNNQFSAGDDEKLLYSFRCSVRPWPLGRKRQEALPDGMTGTQLSGRRLCRFNPQLGPAGTNGAGAIAWPSDGYTIEPGRRLVMKLSVCGPPANPTDISCGNLQPSTNDLVFFYDYARYWSKVNIATETPL